MADLIITLLDNECVITCQNKCANSLLAIDSLAQQHWGLISLCVSIVAAHKIKYHNVLWSLIWPFFVVAMQNKTVTCLWSLTEHWTADRISSSSPFGNKSRPKEEIGKWVCLLSFKDASPHINKIYNDQTAFLKIEDPQIAASLSCQITPNYVFCLFEHAFSESGHITHCTQKYHNSPLSHVLYLRPNRQLVWISHYCYM